MKKTIPTSVLLLVIALSANAKDGPPPIPVVSPETIAGTGVPRNPNDKVVQELEAALKR